jgi:hypothetical protein
MKKNNKKEVIKNSDKNEPIYSFEISVEENEIKKLYKIDVKKPTRTLLTDADMYYSIQLSKYIKMGLLTAEQLAKRQVDVGGTFTDEQQKHYINLQSLMAEKQEMFYRLMAKKDLMQDEEDRKKILYQDIALLKSQIMDYEYIKNQIYEHTANSKARNDVILWWVLNLTNITDITEENPSETKSLFEGESFEIKKLKLDEMEDNESEILKESFSKLVKIITLWYWMGISDKEKLQDILKEEADA